MEFNSTLDLIESDSKSRAYFESLPASVQQELMDRYTGAKTLDELRSFGDDLLLNM